MICVWFAAPVHGPVVQDAPLIFCCRPDNDLYRMAVRAGGSCYRFEDPGDAIAHAKPGSGVLLLEGSPKLAEELKKIRTLNVKLYVEGATAAGPSGRVIDTTWMRAFVTSDVFGGSLKPGRLLSIGRQTLPAIDHPDVLLSLGRVAGFDSLAYGAPKSAFALLWRQSDSVLRSCAPLSRFSSARFAPAKAWKPVIQYILSWVGAKRLARNLKWLPAVTPAYQAGVPGPIDMERRAAGSAVTWFESSRLLLPKSALGDYQAADRWNDRVGPAPLGSGDGTLGLLEGYASAINADGTQPVRWYRRADCNAESAMALALAGDTKQRAIAFHIADFIALKSRVVHDDPKTQSFGLVGWNDLDAQRGTFYGDDNARYILGLIGTAGGLRESRWDAQILKCILANFRTTGVNGFRGDALLEPDIERLGWRHYFDAATVNLAPHFEAYMWACDLWAYAKTGFRPLLDRAERAISEVMTAAEDRWTWTNGVQQERARMLLPLAWLVRVDDTPLHRAWVNSMADKLLAAQAPCGAVREEIGDLSHGTAGPPQSNEAFGTAETPLIQENGDPIADMLYTSNFAFLGLHEAAAATHEPRLIAAENRLADFLCRIQIRSTSHPELDGAWFRAFDFGDWDYWASNADLGWGAWSIESGWSVAWIATVLALRQTHRAFWDVDQGFRPDAGLITLMLP